MERQDCQHCGPDGLEAVGTDHLGQTVWVCQECGRHYRTTHEGGVPGLAALGEDAWEDA